MQSADGEPQSMTSTYITAESESALYRSLRDFWHPVCYSADLGDDKPVGTRLLDESVVVARIGGKVSAFRDLCVHRGAALSLGWIESGRLRCAYHGWTYQDDGRCVEVPARPDLPIPRGACLSRYHAVESGGLVWVCLGEPRFEVPRFPQFADPEYRVVTGQPYDWKTSAIRRVENFVDMAHFAWVHPGVLGSRDHAEVTDHDVWRDGRYLRFEHTVKEPNNGEIKEQLGITDDIFDVRNVYHLSMPLAIHLERCFPNEARYVVFMVSSPVSQKEARSFWFIARNYAADPEHDEGFLDFENLVLSQDKPIVESLRPEEIPMDLTKEMYVRVADAITVEYRRWLLELSRSHADS
ncbi:aromatic ring-hydroxylating dioxygenase subunit alpha [Saccharopolyspora shandongensis]|uniref:aromatic ring-hydroxylating dioxygenase subunit alpha n=1 Tax=Saccharopolyspora shandongensis TaxID=418495 RepID=UPI0033DF7438